MEKKYRMTDRTVELSGEVLYEIQALKDFGSVKAGELGGYISGEYNLSQSGDCWVGAGCIVADNSLVTDDAVISGQCIIQGSSIIEGKSSIRDIVKIRSNSRVSGLVSISGNVIIDNSTIQGKALLGGNLVVGGGSLIEGSAVITGNVIVINSQVSDNALIKEETDFVTINKIGHRTRGSLTFYRSYNNKDIYVASKEFKGSVESFREYITKSYMTQKTYEIYDKAIELALLQLY